jgi:hypothetical protein
MLASCSRGAQQQSRLYLVCRYQGYDNERILALHRIVPAEAASTKRERCKDCDLRKSDAAGRLGFAKLT